MQTIYTANPLSLFGLPLLIALFILTAGFAFAIRWRRNSHNQTDRWLGLALLAGALLVSGYMLAMLALSVTAGANTLVAELTTKRIVTNAENSRYTLDFAAAQRDFVVPRRAYDLVKEGACLEVTYYRDYLKVYSPDSLIRGDAIPQETSALVARIARPPEPAPCR